MTLQNLFLHSLISVIISVVFDLSSATTCHREEREGLGLLHPIVFEMFLKPSNSKCRNTLTPTEEWAPGVLTRAAALQEHVVPNPSFLRV